MDTQLSDALMANIQAQLAQLGIKVKLDGLSFPEYLDTIRHGRQLYQRNGILISDGNTKYIYSNFVLGCIGSYAGIEF